MASSRESPSSWEAVREELAQQEWSELLGALLTPSRSCWTHTVLEKPILLQLGGGFIFEPLPVAPGALGKLERDLGQGME